LIHSSQAGAAAQIKCRLLQVSEQLHGSLFSHLGSEKVSTCSKVSNNKSFRNKSSIYSTYLGKNKKGKQKSPLVLTPLLSFDFLFSLLLNENVKPFSKGRYINGPSSKKAHQP